jgi:hypothetical protein
MFFLYPVLMLWGQHYFLQCFLRNIPPISHRQAVAEHYSLHNTRCLYSKDVALEVCCISYKSIGIRK